LHGFWGDVLVGNSNFPLTDDTRAALAALPGARTASQLTYIPQIDVNGQSLDIVVLEPSDLAREQIATSGRFPIASREIMLGSRAAKAMHKRIGDIVTISGQNEPADFTVVGIGPAPVFGDVPFGGTAVISSAALTDNWPGPPAQMMVVELEHGRRGTSAAVAHLSQQVPDIVIDIVPGKIDNLHDLRGLLLAAAAVAALVAALLVVNANVAATRRRTRDGAILGACGATPADLMAIAGWQGLVLGLAVGVAGTLVGAVAGIRVWQATAHALGVPSRVHVSGWVALAVVVPVAFHVALSTLAWWRVRSSLAARALRAE
jgi:predicted lysophospholipase L1 biosynthesis ABC-type transport system permease subunit